MRKISFIAILKIVSSFCPILDCDSTLKEPTCAVYQLDLDNMLRLRYKGCQNQQTCRFSKLGMRSIGNCDSLSVKPKSFGHPCNKPSDCLSEICVNNRCSVDYIGSICSSHNQCNAVSYCDGKICQLRRFKGDSCVHNYECIFGYECEGSRCRALHGTKSGFSPLDETDGNSINFENYKRFCESGYINSLGICTETTLIDNVPCPFSNNKTVYCRYRTEGDQIVEIANKCNCSFNSSGSAMCELGSSSEVYKIYLQLKKEILSRTCGLDSGDDLINCVEVTTEEVKKLVSLENSVKQINLPEVFCYAKGIVLFEFLLFIVYF